MPLYHGQLTGVSYDETKRYAGIKSNHYFPESSIQNALLEAQLLAKPQGIYEIYSYNNLDQLIQSTPPIQLLGSSITKHLSNCYYVAMMAITIGEPIEMTITNHFGTGNYTAGLLLDAAATAAVESIADQVNHLIDSLATKDGYATTWRFSPGYGDWNITIQQKILTALHAETIGLTATESFMLQPRKSITAAIGLRSKNCCQNNLPQTTSCATCAQKTCLARKEI